MIDYRIKNLARTLVEYSTEVQPGDLAGIVAYPYSPRLEPLLAEVYQNVLRAGGHPVLLVEFESTEHIFFKEASDEQLTYISPFTESIYKDLHVLISLSAAENTQHLSGVDPENRLKFSAARNELRDILLARSAKKEMKWTGARFPTPAYAQEANMSLPQYEDFVYAATFADTEDPVQAWKDLSSEQEKLVQWMHGKSQMVLLGENINLSFSIKDRIFINSDGKHNMPSGEIFTAPVEDSVNGWVKFTYPGLRWGQEVDGIALEFSDGKITKATAERNEEMLLKTLDTDEGSRYLGEFGIGTNPNITQFTKSTLYDEKLMGTIHLAVGFAYPECGGLNKSAIHWDMICDMRKDGQIIVDDELFYEAGEFLV